MIRKLVLSVVALFGLTTVMMGQPPAPVAAVSKAFQGGQSTTVAVSGSWGNCGNVVTKVEILIKYNPVAGGVALTKKYPLTAPPAIMGMGNWAFTTAVNDFAVGDTVTTTFIVVYKGAPGNYMQIVSDGNPGQNLKIQ